MQLEAHDQDHQADLLFRNGNIITMNKFNLNPQFVCVKGGQIVAVESEEEKTKQWIGNSTKIIDLQGHTMLPGFIDPHIHYTFAHMNDWVDLTPFNNADINQIWHKIEEATKNAKQGQWVRCYGYDYVVTPGYLDLSLKKLDTLSSEIPILIIQINYHVAHANSAAFTRSGITKQSPDPPHSRFVRDEEGNLTGRIQQIPAISLISNNAPSISIERYVQNIHTFFKRASSKGCSSIHDCGIGAHEAKMDYEALQRVMKENPCVRLSGFLVSHAWEYWKQLGLKPQKEDKYFRINGIKCWSDGSIQCGSAYLKQPYSDLFCGCGAANYSQQYLNSIVQKAHLENWQIGIHANGDAAIEMVLDAYEKVLTQYPQPDMRHRIEHCSMCRPDQFQRMKKLDVHPSFLIGHIYYYGELFNEKVLGQKRAVHSVKSALKNGLRPTLHSDDRCQPLDPLRCIYNAVTRKMKRSGKVLNEEQKISVYEGLQMMTINAAWQCQTDKLVGSIEVGKLADFVVLDRDILSVEQDSIMDIQVLQTWMDGVLRYNRNSPS